MKVTKLGDVADVNWGDTSVTKASYVDEGYTAYSATGADGYLPYFHFERDAIVLSAIGARCGKTWFATGKWSVIKNTIRFWSESKDLDNRYLYWITSNPDFWPKRGAAQPFITIGDARKLEIRFPSLNEQRCVAKLLDQTESVWSKRRQVTAKLHALCETVFNEMFGDLNTNPFKWDDKAVLGDVADIVSGVTKGRPLKGRDSKAVPYLAVVNVQDKRLWLDSVKSIEVTEDELARYRLRRDDLLLTEGGDPDKLGRGTLWNDELPECIHQNHIFRVRVTDNRIAPLYLNWLVGSKFGKSYFLRSAKQTTGIASINKTQLGQFPLLLPPITHQLKFAKVLDRVHKVTIASRNAEREMERLFASLQHRAFSGQLTASQAERDLEMAG